MRPLQILADLYQLELAFDDVFGNRQEASDYALQLVLEAMGVSCSSPEACDHAIASRQAELWAPGFDPVTVFRHQRQQKPRIRVFIPRHELDTSFQWQVVLENGNRAAQGQATGSQLPQEGKSPDGVDPQTVVCILELPEALPLGYHEIQMHASWLHDQHKGSSWIISAPEQAYLPNLPDDKGLWGLSCQLYSIKSERNWGLGDFTDLQHLLGWAADQGASTVGLNPLHALYPHNPHHISPYSPSSRLFFNSLYIDVEAVPEFSQSERAEDITRSGEYQNALETLRNNELVDYPWIGYLKNQVFEALFTVFETEHLAKDTERAKAFKAFQEREGQRLILLSTYQALHEALMKQDESLWGWPVWPEKYQHPASSAVALYAEENAQRVTYYQYLQFLVDEQLQACSNLAKQKAMPVGLYLDLAVGADRAGVDLWCEQDLYSFDASLGCPPDLFNQMGQNWGLPPLKPAAFTKARYAPFVQMLRSNMRHAGALRMDHALSLFRVYWVPLAGTAKDGAYVRYNHEHLLAIIALESQRNQCVVIGEDLGTVPDFVSDGLKDWGILSYKVFLFEKDDEGAFFPPEAYPRRSLVTLSTHDLPPLKSFWEAGDVTLRADLQLFPNEEAKQSEYDSRPWIRGALLKALEEQQLLPDGVPVNGHEQSALTDDLSLAFHRFLARTNSMLLMVQLEDLLMQQEQMNMPGTTNEHPNWRRRLRLPLQAFAHDPLMQRFCHALQLEQSRINKLPAGVC